MRGLGDSYKKNINFNNPSVICFANATFSLAAKRPPFVGYADISPVKRGNLLKGKAYSVDAWL